MAPAYDSSIRVWLLLVPSVASILCWSGKQSVRNFRRLPYLLDQTPLSISRRSRIVAAPPEVLNEIVAALE